MKTIFRTALPVLALVCFSQYAVGDPISGAANRAAVEFEGNTGQQAKNSASKVSDEFDDFWNINVPEQEEDPGLKQRQIEEEDLGVRVRNNLPKEEPITAAGDTFNKQYQELAQRNLELEQQLQHMREEKHAAEVALKTANAKIDEQKVKLEKRKQTKHSLQKEVSDVKDLNESLQRENAKMLKEIEEKGRKLAEINGLLESREVILKGLDNKLAQIEKELTQKEDELKALNTELEKSKKEGQTWKGIARDSENMNRDLQAQIYELNQQISQGQDAIKAQEEAAKRLEEDKAKLEKDLAAQGGKNSELEKRLAENKKKQDKLKKNLKDANMHQKVLKQELDKVQISSNNAKIAANNANVSYDAAKNEAKRAREERKKFEDLYDKSLDEIAELKAQLSVANDKIAKYEKKIEVKDEKASVTQRAAEKFGGTLDSNEQKRKNAEIWKSFDIVSNK